MKFQTFLKKYKIDSKKRNKQDLPITHTRMGDIERNIVPGSYSIPDSEMETFYKLLYNDVIHKKGQEYLTESQLKEDGGVNRCIAIDFDFNYETGTPRSHTNNEILAIICSLLNALKTMFDFGSNPEKFNIYVFEREQPYDCPRKKCTKDGIHIIIGMKADTIQNNLLRDKVLQDNEFIALLAKLPLINKPSDVFDNSISTGVTNWQVYGCRKPGKEPYILSFYYTVEWVIEDNDFISDYLEGNTFDFKENLKALSVRNKAIPLFSMTDEFERSYNEIKHKNSTPKRESSYTQLRVRNIDFRFDTVNPENIKNEEDLQKVLKMWYDSFGEESDIRYGHIKCKLKEIHDISMILPDDYSDDFDKWLRVGWALFNTSNNDYMFYTWMLFSSRSSKFDYNDIPLYYSEKYWNGFTPHLSKQRGYTAGSIVYWAREYWNKNSTGPDDNKFLQIKQDTLNYFIQQSCEQTTDFDLAKVLYHFCKDKFVCAEVKNSQWFEFKNHKYKRIDSGVNLSLIISTNLYQLYHSRMIETCKSLKNIQNDEQQWKEVKIKLKALADICTRLRDTTKKEKIMKAAKELFYDPNFNDKIDTNSKLLGCNNGVVDFEKNVFRPGDSSDYITKSTKLDYIPSDKIPKKIKDEINDFMQKLFPIPELLKYMWQMLASCLVGNNKNQTFHIFTGGGSNGKSLLMKLMKYVLGEYYGIVPISIITEKRPKIGGVSPEIMNLMGVRLAVINEPTRGDKINEGPMKALTGGDDIQGRGLFKDTVTFTPSFKLAVCTNVLFDIDATDDGTWRRIKVVPFVSHFTENPDSEKEYEFEKDMELEDKMLKNWVEPFMSMLVEIAFKTGGLVNIKCDVVDSKSNEYRNNQDHIMNFINEKIVPAPGEKIKKGELAREFEDWFKMNYGRTRGAPKMKDIYPVMDKKYGKYHNMGWHNITIVNENIDEEI